MEAKRFHYGLALFEQSSLSGKQISCEKFSLFLKFFYIFYRFIDVLSCDVIVSAGDGVNDLVS